MTHVRFRPGQTFLEIYNETPYVLDLDFVRYHDWLCFDDRRLPNLAPGETHTISWSRDSCTLKSVRFRVVDTGVYYQQDFPEYRNKIRNAIIPSKGILKYYIKWEDDEPLINREIFSAKENRICTLFV